LTLKNLERYEEAIACYDKAIEIEPDYYSDWRNKGDAFFYLKRYEDAVACYDKAIEIQPDDDYAWGHKGAALGNLKRHEEAIACYDKAIEMQPDDDYAWNSKGYLLEYYFKRYKEAIACYKKAIKIKSDNPDYYNDIGINFVNLERYEKAITAYDKALKIKPDYSKTWYNKACCCSLQGNAELAVKNLQKAINLNGKECLEWAKTDTDFDSIRESDHFQELINQQTDLEIIF
jgi:superkiller protein 3